MVTRVRGITPTRWASSLAVLALLAVLAPSALVEESGPFVAAQFRFQQGGGDPRGNRQRQQYEQNLKNQPKEKTEDYYKVLGL